MAFSRFHAVKERVLALAEWPRIIGFAETSARRCRGYLNPARPHSPSKTGVNALMVSGDQVLWPSSRPWMPAFAGMSGELFDSSGRPPHAKLSPWYRTRHPRAGT